MNFQISIIFVLVYDELSKHYRQKIKSGHSVVHLSTEYLQEIRLFVV